MMCLYITHVSQEKKCLKCTKKAIEKSIKKGNLLLKRMIDENRQ